MDKLEVTWGRTILVWWSFFWRTALIGFVVGFVPAFIVNFIGTLAEKPEWISAADPFIGGLALWVGIPISIVVFRKILTKKYNQFSIALAAE